MSPGAWPSNAIPGVGETVPTGCPSRANVQDAPGGAVVTKIPPGSGRFGRQPTSAKVQIAIAIEMCRITVQIIRSVSSKLPHGYAAGKPLRRLWPVDKAAADQLA